MSGNSLPADESLFMSACVCVYARARVLVFVRVSVKGEFKKNWGNERKRRQQEEGRGVRKG